MIGTNNTGQRNDPPAVTIAGVKKILSVIAEKQPKATTILCAIFPRGEKADHPMRRRNAIVNRELQKYADGRKVVWCDFTDKFLFADGTMPSSLMPDFLHPREEGYMIWTSAILPIVKECFEGGAFPIASVYPARPCREAFSDEKSMSLRPVTRICQPSWRGPDWWGDRLSRNLGAIRSFKGKVDVVFAGDSITHFWEDYGGAEYASLTNRYRVLNLGYGGDQTQNVLWRFENGELDGYSAKAAVLMIGTNNNGVGGADPAVTAEGIKACVALLRKKQPNAKVFLMSLLPRAVGVSDGDPSRDNGADGRNRRTNQILRDYADGKDVVFIDIYDRYLVDGKIPKALMADRIHPTEKGYAIWRKELENRLSQIIKK
jgi:beta-glucosidase